MTIEQFTPGDTKITSKKTLESWNNSQCSGETLKITGRTYNDAKSCYLAWRLILTVDYMDLYDAETESDIPFSEYVETMIDCYLDILYSDGVQAFIDACNETIHKYNQSKHGFYNIPA